jgi:hypothetical protein
MGSVSKTGYKSLSRCHENHLGARHWLRMTFEPLSEKAINEIVEEVFLPLVRPTDQRISS